MAVDLRTGHIATLTIVEQTAYNATRLTHTTNNGKENAHASNYRIPSFTVADRI